MKILYVVQRYGEEVAGGAEQHCRVFATRLAALGHDVEVLTSCALSYVDWADHYPPGTTELDGVAVHRLPVVRPRNDRFFSPLNARVVWSKAATPPYLQREWMKMQGPWLDGFDDWLVLNAPRFDVVIFFTYLYHTTWRGLQVVSGRVPTILHPTAHDEPPIYLPLFQLMFRLPDSFAFSTEEERSFVAERFNIRPRGDVIGIGMEVDVVADASLVRQSFEIGDDPYVLYLGRIDPGKGAEELYDFFVAFKDRHPGPLKLVMMGEPVRPLAPHPDIVITGFVDDRMKRAGIEGSWALIQPSYFESFSMVLTEAWAQRRPALVQGHCEVLVGQVMRSGGGIPYFDFASFEAALEALLEDQELRSTMGEAGSRYVRDRYEWSVVMDRYQALISRTVDRSLLRG